MGALLALSRAIDSTLGFFGKIGAWASLLLVLIVCYDVVSRYFGVPKPFGLNSTMIQESEYWVHTYLFALVIGYAYTRQAHVRIDLFREGLPRRGRYLIELIGCLLFLVPYAGIGIYLASGYVATSFAQGEVSKSVIGLSNIWALKGALYPLYVFMGLAGVSQFIKALAGLFDRLPEAEVGAVIGTSAKMFIEDALPLLMFAALALLLFSGYPVAFVLGGIGLGFGLIGMELGVFHFVQFKSIPSRIFGGIMENLILTAIPMFIFMGTMLEKSGVARDLLNCLQVLLRRVPGGLALSVTVMGTILAATTGIIGASVVMMSLLALPTMLQRRYSVPLATGTIAASGTLGILIPPSIMLVIMADLLGRSVGNLFVAAVFPGLLLAGLYMVYILVVGRLNPQSAPPLPDAVGPSSGEGIAVMVLRSFVPPVFLIVLVLGSILGGFATPTEAAGVGAMGALVLAFVNLVLLPSAGVAQMAFEGAGATVDLDDHGVGGGFMAELRHFGGILKEVVERTAMTNAMIFGLFVGATVFSFVFRSLGGDHIVIDLVESMGLGSWGLLLIIMGIVFFLGFFFDWIEITLIVLPVFAPIVELMDFGAHVDRFELVYWFAILIAVNLQTSFLTPPFGFALFYMKAVAPPEVKIQQIYRGIIPFVLLQLAVLALLMAFPDIALWLPRVLLN